MAACARLSRPFALARLDSAPSHNGPRLRPPPWCGTQFTAGAGFRVDSPWISPQTANVWTGHGLPTLIHRLPTLHRGSIGRA